MNQKLTPDLDARIGAQLHNDGLARRGVHPPSADQDVVQSGTDVQPSGRRRTKEEIEDDL